MSDLYLRIRTLHPGLSADDFDAINGVIRLQDDGDGPYIAKWEHPTLPQPTEQQLMGVEPKEPVPEHVTRAQGKAALIQASLWHAVVSYVDAIADPTEQALARVALDDTLEWRRDSPFLNAAATALDLSGEQLDDLFRQAATIKL